MAVLKNKTKRENFLVVSKIFLQDTKLSLVERGLLATMHSLPDNWDFTIKGMAKLLPGGEDKITTALNGLVTKGYVAKKQSKTEVGKFGKNLIEIYENPVHENPIREKPVAENPRQYNTKEYNINECSTNQSINPSYKADEHEGLTEEACLKELVADNIRLDWLLSVAKQHGEDEVAMVNEVYDVICDMVCYPRDKVLIKGTTYPWNVVKAQFLKLRYEHIGNILNRIIDADLGIKNMSAYLISTLYTASLVGNLEAQAELYDDYLKFLRGKIYD